MQPIGASWYRPLLRSQHANFSGPTKPAPPPSFFDEQPQGQDLGLDHKWSSLVCTVFMLLLCLTGLPLIFHHEIGHLLGTEVEAPEHARRHCRAPASTA